MHHTELKKHRSLTKSEFNVNKYVKIHLQYPLHVVVERRKIVKGRPLMPGSKLETRNLNYNQETS